MEAGLRSSLILTCVLAWRQVLYLGPYVAGGIVLAVILGQFDLPRRWQRWLRHRGVLSVFGAAFLGAASPVSSIGAVPLLLRLLQQGAPVGPILAFLSASTMLNPQLFLLVLGGLGWRVALAHAGGVLFLCAAAGWAATKLSSCTLLLPPASSDSAATPSPGRFSWSRLGRDFLGLSGWVGLNFTVGVLLSAILQVFVPPHWIVRWLGEGNPGAVVAAALLGLPLYICGGSVVPLLAALTRSGMGYGTALAFLLSGPATRIHALAAMGTVLRRRVLGIYVVYVLLGAVLIGAVFR